jgi:hypothetical protein
MAARDRNVGLEPPQMVSGIGQMAADAGEERSRIHRSGSCTEYYYSILMDLTARHNISVARPSLTAGTRPYLPLPLAHAANNLPTVYK